MSTAADNTSYRNFCQVRAATQALSYILLVGTKYICFRIRLPKLICWDCTLQRRRQLEYIAYKIVTTPFFVSYWGPNI